MRNCTLFRLADGGAEGAAAAPSTSAADAARARTRSLVPGADSHASDGAA